MIYWIESFRSFALESKLNICMRLYLIRHGQSTWNQENRIQGHSNPPLSEKGRDQIAKLIARLKGERITKIIASPLVRAYESAQILAKGLGVFCVGHEELKEIYLGKWEGRRPEEVNQLYNNGYKKWLTAPSKIKLPKAETIPKFCTRVVAGFERILTTEQQERIAIVTHGGVLAALISHWLKADFDHALLNILFENSSLTIAEVYDGRVYLTDINDTCHLHRHPLPSSFDHRYS